MCDSRRPANGADSEAPSSPTTEAQDGPTVRKPHGTPFSSWTVLPLDDVDGVTWYFYLPTQLADRARDEGRQEAVRQMEFDNRPCSVECCDAQRVRHVHEGTHEDHTGDGRWCIDCDVVIGVAGLNASESSPLDRPIEQTTAYQLGYQHAREDVKRERDASESLREAVKGTPYCPECGNAGCQIHGLNASESPPTEWLNAEGVDVENASESPPTDERSREQKKIDGDRKPFPSLGDASESPPTPTILGHWDCRLNIPHEGPCEPRDASESGQPQDDPISDSRQPEDGPPPGRWPR